MDTQRQDFRKRLEKEKSHAGKNYFRVETFIEGKNGFTLVYAATARLILIVSLSAVLSALDVRTHKGAADVEG